MTKGTKIAVGVAIVLVLGLVSAFNFGDGTWSLRKTATTTPEAGETATSSEELVTTYFGNAVEADFNGDGVKDSAFIVTQTGSGSGTFFYLAHTLGGEAVFLGDRIAPQSTEWKGGRLIVNYADRKPNEPMTTKPSVGVSKYLEVQGNTFVETKPAQGEPSGTTSSAGQKCTAQGGTWSEQYKECTGIGEASCKAIGGTFNECASACRNDPNAEVCILLCMQVCTFK